MLSHSSSVECFCYFRKNEGCPESGQGLNHKCILSHLLPSPWCWRLYWDECLNSDTLGIFTRRQMSYLPHLRNLAIWNKRMQRCCEMDVKQTRPLLTWVHNSTVPDPTRASTRPREGWYSNSEDCFQFPSHLICPLWQFVQAGAIPYDHTWGPYCLITSFWRFNLY